MRIVPGDQGSPEWLSARRGLITASRMADVMSYLARGGESKARSGYRMELIAERLTGMATETFVSQEMKDGIEREPYARTEYELRNDVIVNRVGFVLHPTMDFCGASPDGIIQGVNGGIELKCPKATTHLRWMLEGKCPDDHIDQCHWVITCCELDYLDFCSFMPAMNDEKLRLFGVRINRDETRILEMEAEARKMEDEIQAAIDNIMHGRAYDLQYVQP